MQTTIEHHFHPDFSQRNVYLDSQYVTAVGRVYTKFSKSKKKESFRFPKGLLQYFASKTDRNVERRRYYFPLNICKRHWVGVCVDHTSGKITVLDCNTDMFSDAMIEKQLYPHLVMIHYLLRECGEAYGCEDASPFSFERPKCVSQSVDPFDCGLMTVLLMATHAVYGIEACKNIHQSMLAEEGKSAAIMAFEL